MNNGLKPSKVNLSIEAMPYFSASIQDMRISPITRVVMSMPEAALKGSLSISIVGKYGDIEFLRRCDFERECFNPEMYNLKNTLSSVLEFDFDSFEFDTAFLNSLEEEVMADIYVLVNNAGFEYMAKTHILLLPYNTWLGLEGEPSVIASFVKSDSQVIRKLCEAIVEDGKINYALSSKKSTITAIKNLYKKLKDCNIIYTRPAGYAANAKQLVRFPEELFGCSSILATPLEIALVFCACAKNIGFDTSLLFVRGVEGEIGVLCGVHLVKSRVYLPVCENAKEICALVESGDMLVIDPSVFAAAQNTNFVMALDNAAENFVKNAASLVCLVEINRALECANHTENDQMFQGYSVKNSVALVYSSLISSPVMQFLAGNERRELEQIPLLLCDFDGAFNDNDGVYKLLPLDININLSDFAAIDKDFSSILTMSSPMARQHFSSNELSRMKLGFERLKERVNKQGAFTTALRDEELYRAASEMTFGKSKKEPFFAYGFVKITDKLTELVSFAPVCLVKAKIEYLEGNFYVSQAGKPVVNKVFIRNALKDSSLGYDSFMKSLMPTDKKEIFELFENIRLALKETDDRHIYEIVKEAHLVNLDIDDYTLWCNLALERNKLASNDTVKKLFGEKPQEMTEFDTSYVPAIPMQAEAVRAVVCKDDVLVEGAFTKEKEEVFLSLAAKSINLGQNLLVVTDDMEMSRYARNLLENGGMGEGVFVVEEDYSSKKAVEKIYQNLDKYKDEPNPGFKDVPEELAATNELLLDYTLRLNTKHKLGMSLKEALEACFASGKGIEDEEIYVDKSIFCGIDEKELDKIFEEVGDLITSSRNLCKNSGLEKNTPICKHPLYNTRPKGQLDLEVKRIVADAVMSALPVVSEYRDVFLDVNEILGIDNRELDSMYKLEKLNELYKLVLSARDLDIPEKFVESDIADFSRNKRFIAENKKRMEAIEFKLNFFNPEIFEDVETLLTGDEYDDVEKGFLKKFMHKRNSQEILLQYVEHEKKGEFQQHKVSDIYKMLYEYKACLKTLRENSLNEAKVNELEVKLAKVSEKAAYLVDEISAVSDADKKRRLSNVFRLISVIPIDSNLARKITVVRARLAELYSGENSVVKILEKHLGLIFDEVVFEDGILSFNGIGKYLEEIASHLEVSDLWATWQKRVDSARLIVPGLVKYLEKHGSGGNVDRLFAKSLLIPICECVREDMFEGFSMEKLGKAKDKYCELLFGASEASKHNAVQSYKEKVKSFSQAQSVDVAADDRITFRELVERNLDLVQKMLPVIIVTKNMLTDVLPLNVSFDRAVLFDNKNNGFSMLPAIGFAKKTTLINMSKNSRSELALRFAENVPCFDVSRYTDNKDAAVFSWLNSSLFEEKAVCISNNARSSVELVRMNGTFERTTARTNKTEAELSIVKATELLNDETKRVAICAFTLEQCSSIERLARVLSKKNRIIDKAIKENRLSVCTPDRLYLKEYDSLVVSACFGADRDARIGWDFGYASLSEYESVPEAYVAICEKMCEKIYFLTSLNVKDSRFLRRTGNNAAVFNSFCEMLCDGRIPVCMSKPTENDDNLLCELLSGIINGNKRLSICEGHTAIKHALFSKESLLYVILDNDRNLTMHDELLIKHKLEHKGNLVATLSPYSFAGYDYKETLKSLEEGN